MTPREHLVLYVDDEWANRIVFEQSFGKTFRVKAVESGPAALAHLEQEAAAVVLTDQRMPDMSGHDLLIEVKRRWPEAVRMVITAYSDLDPILRAVNEGLVARYIIKPWDRAELEATLRWGIEAHELARRDSAVGLRLMQNERLATLGSVAAMMLHDLRGPLGNVTLNTSRLVDLSASMGRLAEVLRRHGAGLPAADRRNLSDLVEELPDLAREMASSCEVMRGLTRDLGQFVRPEQANGAPAADPLPVIQHALAVCRDAAQRVRGKLGYEGPPSLPRVAIATTDLAQVFINLVANAAQALGRKGARGGEVRVRADAGERGVTFVVADNGPGMSEELLRKVGTPFFTTRPEGTGLGVVQCRRLVERAGGTLEIASREGEGTSVTFTLRRA